MQPIGARACCSLSGESKSRNEWDYCHDCREEINTLHAGHLDLELSEAEHADLQALLNKLMVKAMMGKIVFRVSEDTHNPDADIMTLKDCQFIYELRPQPEGTMRFGVRQLPKRVARLYCAEPKHDEAKILGLHLATKTSGQDVDQEQNAAILESASRANAWEYSKIIEKLNV